MKFLNTEGHLKYLHLLSGRWQIVGMANKKLVATQIKAFPKILSIIYLHLSIMKCVLFCLCSHSRLSRIYFHIDTFSFEGFGKYLQRKIWIMRRKQMVYCMKRMKLKKSV